MRCPTCGARNAESAEWCTQCYTSLAAPPPPAPPAQPGQYGEPSIPPPPGAPAAPTDAAGLDGSVPVRQGSGAGVPSAQRPAGRAQLAVGEESSDGRFRRTEDGLDWRCGVCEEWNPLEVQRCVVCGSSFGRAVGADGDVDDLEPIDERSATALSALLPGIGHLQAGRKAAGYMRMVLYVVMLLGGLSLLRAAAEAGQSILPAIPLLAGAMAVLFASVFETQRLARGDDRPLMDARFVLWLVVGVLGSLMAAFLVTALTATRGGGAA